MNSSPPDSLIRHNNIQKDFSGLFNNRTARLFVFYQCSIRFFLTKIFLNFTLFTFFHNLIFTDRRKFIMWEPIFLGQSFFTSFPISLTTFSSSSCNCKQQQEKLNMFISSCFPYNPKKRNLEYLWFYLCLNKKLTRAKSSNPFEGNAFKKIEMCCQFFLVRTKWRNIYSEIWAVVGNCLFYPLNPIIEYLVCPPALLYPCYWYMSVHLINFS